MLGINFSFGSEEFKLKRKIKKLISLLSKNKKTKFVNSFNSEETQELINSVLIELGLFDKKGCYSPNFVEEVIKKLDERRVFVRELKNSYAVIENTKRFLQMNAASLPNQINWLNFKKREDVDFLIRVLNDPTINSKLLSDIVWRLLNKKIFIEWKFDWFVNIVDTILTHPSLNEQILDRILLFKWDEQEIVVWKKRTMYWSKPIKNKIASNELELMFFKSYFITHHNLNLYKYRDLLDWEYLTIIKNVFENRNIDIDKKKYLILKLKLDTLQILKRYIKTMLAYDKEELERFINIAYFLKQYNEIEANFKLNKDDIEIIKAYLESDYCDLDKEKVKDFLSKYKK